MILAYLRALLAQVARIPLSPLLNTILHNTIYIYARPGIFNRVHKLVLPMLPEGKWRDERLIDMAEMCKNRAAEFKRCGEKGGVVRITLSEEDLKSPLKILLAAGKVVLVDKHDLHKRGKFSMAPFSVLQLQDGPGEEVNDQSVESAELAEAATKQPAAKQPAGRAKQPAKQPAAQQPDTRSKQSVLHLNSYDAEEYERLFHSRDFPPAALVGGSGRLNDAYPDASADGSADGSRPSSRAGEAQSSAAKLRKHAKPSAAKPSAAKRPSAVKPSAVKPAAKRQKPAVAKVRTTELVAEQLCDMPAFSVLKKTMDLAVLRTAYPKEKVASASCIGWRTPVTDLVTDKEKVQWVKLFGILWKYSDPRLSGVNSESEESSNDPNDFRLESEESSVASDNEYSHDSE